MKKHSVKIALLFLLMPLAAQAQLYIDYLKEQATKGDAQAQYELA
ncbi:MAG: hypothetical protein RIG61_04255 [Deltaproteobacteria bacterium]